MMDKLMFELWRGLRDLTTFCLCCGLPHEEGIGVDVGGNAMRNMIIATAIFIALVMSACSPRPQDYAQAEILNAQAEATRIANQYQQQKNNQDIAIRATAAAAELQARIAKIDAERQSSIAIGNAKSRAIEVGGYGAAVLLAGFAVALVTVAIAFGISFGRRSILASQYVPFGVESSTLLPPPVVVTHDGYLIDTRTGERARIRDAAGVNRLRLAATTQATNLAIMARAAKDIAARGKVGNAEPADVLPGIAASVPLLNVIDNQE